MAPAPTVDDASLLAATVKSVDVKPCIPVLKSKVVVGVNVAGVVHWPYKLEHNTDKAITIKPKVKILLMTIKFKFKRFGKGSQEHWGRILDKVQ